MDTASEHDQKSTQGLIRGLSKDAPSPPPRSRGKTKSVTKVMIKEVQNVKRTAEGENRPPPPPKPSSLKRKDKTSKMTKGDTSAKSETKVPRPPLPARPPGPGKKNLKPEGDIEKDAAVTRAKSAKIQSGDIPAEGAKTEGILMPPKPNTGPVPKPKPRKLVQGEKKLPCKDKPKPAPRPSRSLSQTEHALSKAKSSVPDSLKLLDDINQNSIDGKSVNVDSVTILESSVAVADTIDSAAGVESGLKPRTLEESVGTVKLNALGHSGDVVDKKEHYEKSVETSQQTTVSDNDTCQIEAITADKQESGAGAPEDTAPDPGTPAHKQGTGVANLNQDSGNLTKFVLVRDSLEGIFAKGNTVSQIVAKDPTYVDNISKNTKEITSRTTEEAVCSPTIVVSKLRSHSYENVPLSTPKDADVEPRRSWAGPLSPKEVSDRKRFQYENVEKQFSFDNNERSLLANIYSHPSKNNTSCTTTGTTIDVVSISTTGSTNGSTNGCLSSNVGVDLNSDMSHEHGEYVVPGNMESCYVDMTSKDDENGSSASIQGDLDHFGEAVRQNYQVPSSPSKSAMFPESFSVDSTGVDVSIQDAVTRVRRPAPPPPVLAMRDPLKARPWHERGYSPAKTGKEAEVDGELGSKSGNAKKDLSSRFAEEGNGEITDAASGITADGDHQRKTDSWYASPSINSSTSSLPQEASTSSDQGSNTSQCELLHNFTPDSKSESGTSHATDTSGDHSDYVHPRSSIYSQPSSKDEILQEIEKDDEGNVYIDMSSDNTNLDTDSLHEDTTIDAKHREQEDFNGRESGIVEDDDDHVYLQPVDANSGSPPLAESRRLPPARPPPPHFSSYEAEENFYEKINSLKKGMTMPVTQHEDDFSTETESEDEMHPFKPHEHHEHGDHRLYHIASEILSTERTFVAALKLLVDDFGGSLRKIIAKDPKALPEGGYTQMFMNIEQIYSLDKKFLQDLEVRMRNWDEHKKIGDIIREYGHFLKMYTSYIKGYDKAVTIFQDNLVRYPKFAVLVREFERSSKCKNLKLTSYMLKPIQRIPSYRLLLIDYLKHLPRDSSDFRDISDGLHIVSEVAEHINDSMKEGEKFQEVLRVQSQIINSNEIVKPGRFLVKEGMLHKLSRKESQERMFFLFTDALLYCAPFGHAQFKLIQELPLAGMTVHVPESVDFLNEFTVVSTKRSFTLAASTPEERLMWLEALNGAISDVAKKLVSFAVKLEHEENSSYVVPSHDIGAVAPPWIPDDRVTMCQRCTTSFTVYNRRHHCRACGQVVCSQCSSYEAPLQYMDYEAARVCEECFNNLLDALEKATREGDTTKHSPKISKNEILARFKTVRKKKRSRQGRKSLPSKFTEVRAQDIGTSNSGYMRVRKGKAWKKYWFVLKEHVLYCYKASSDPAALETLPVLGYEVKQGNWDGEEYTFQLMHHGLKEPLSYKCETKVAAQRWIECLSEAIALDTK